VPSLLTGQIGIDVAAEQVLPLQQDEGEGLVVIQARIAKVQFLRKRGLPA